tara:strand:+ start:841 stop:1200 length:360 start_codon:yes stop_codon:yes gene_type:complete
MATFDQATVGTDVTPDFGAQVQSRPNVRSIQFGSGYQQRAQFGINQNPKVWNLTWTAQSNTAADAIEAFLDARAGIESFNWTPLNSSTSYKWICRSWQRQHQYADINTVTATFEQVFEV